MENLVKQIEKGKPFFEKVSRNKYLRAIKDGFISAMPVVLFSSLFMLIAYVPNVFGLHWSPEVEAMIVKPYNYSMGILGLLVSGTTARALARSFNRDLEKTNQINETSVMLAAIVGFLLLAADSIEGGLSSGFLGTTGLISGFVSAFVVVNIYNLFIKNNITIKMPDEVPPNISQTFLDVLPFAATTLVLYGIDLIVRQFSGVNFAQMVIELFQPLFSAADGYLGLALIYGAMAMFWFVGIHGPSIVEPAVAAIMYVNLDANLALLQAGEQASNVITPGTQNFIATLGGTGATFVVPFMFMWLAKSKQMKAIGKASVIPTSFGVNEPLLFGGPIILNPIFFVPFILTPIINVWIFKAFVDLLGMNSFMYFLPWPTPGPIGIILGTGFDPLAFVLAALLLVVDVAIYYPFLKVYDQQLTERELEEVEAEEKAEAIEEYEEVEMAAQGIGVANTTVAVESKSVSEDTEEAKDKSEIKPANVLVLCAGGGTSRQLANALNKGATETGLPVAAAGETYGSHSEILSNYDVVILAPQVVSNYEDIKKETDKEDIKLVKTAGMEYIKLTQNPAGAVDFIMDVLNENKTSVEMAKEIEIEESKETEETKDRSEIKPTNVLVLCAGGGTSRQLANSLNKGATETGLPVEAAGETYGSHSEMLPNYDVVILAPQVASNYEDIKKETDKEGVKLIKTAGMEYIKLTQNPSGAVDFILEALN